MKIKSESNKLDIVADDLLSFFPLLYRKVFNPMQAKNKSNPINLQFHVLAMLANQGVVQSSEIGLKFGISRPNVTSLVDKLLEKGYVERMHDASDRRVIRIGATGKGRQFVLKKKNIIKNSLKKMLFTLTDEDLNELYGALVVLKKIISEAGDSK